MLQVMDKYLKDLISEGEHQQLDFKFCISDSRKIAKTLSAFANTDGGKLLIGIRDNGSIAGIRSEEEYYMIETAANYFCRPEVPVTVIQHHDEGKTILEVEILRGNKRPYMAKGDDGKWRAYFRKQDQNILANKVILSVWKKQKNDKGVYLSFGKAENILMEYLKNNESITLSRFKKITNIPSRKAERIIVDLILCGILSLTISGKGYNYELKGK
jgi:predicted HTH transcriptional regulator